MGGLFRDVPSRLRAKMASIYGGLVLFNIGAWVWAVLAFRHQPALLGTCFLAYSFGLRHAVDADHIAAIDNVTRKLMQEGKRPVAVGCMFSLGHSTVVVIGSVVIASTTLSLQHRLDAARAVGGVIGALISSAFLFGIAAINLTVFRSVYRTFARIRGGAADVEDDLDLLLSGGGFLTRLLRPLFSMMKHSWQMYPLGVLFGLGFDTATEIGLLGISATAGSKGLSFGSILVFPILFTAGMSLVDTTDNVLMIGAYGWALARPIRKLYYNMTITFISVVVAVVVGGIEALGLIGNQFHLGGVFWRAVGLLNGNFGVLGYAIIGFFVLSWIVSVAYYRWRRLDRFDVRLDDISEC